MEPLCTSDEPATFNRFRSILKKFEKRHGNRSKSFAIARVMLRVLQEKGMDARAFVLHILEKQVFGKNRLNVVVRMNLFCVAPDIILDDLFTEQHSGTNLEKAVNNFPAKDVVNLLNLVAANFATPDALVAHMKKADCFRVGYAVDVANSRWSEKSVKEFILFCSEKLGVEVPEKARLLFLRTRLDKELKTYFRGETEIIDFYQICRELARSDEDLYRFCVGYVAIQSTPVAEYLAKMKNTPFAPNEGANDFVPKCVDHPPLHAYACEKATVIDDQSAVIELEKGLDDSRHIAVLYHVTTLHDQTKCNLISIRTRKRVFFYIHNQSRRYKEQVGLALRDKVGGKRVFAFNSSKAAAFFDSEFKWTPSKLVDLRELAERNNVDPTVEGIAKALSGGHCSRGKNFTNSSVPSPMALWHLDIYTSVLYEFGVRMKNLRGQEMTDAARDENERRARAREREERREQRRVSGQSEDSGRTRSNRR